METIIESCEIEASSKWDNNFCMCDVTKQQSPYLLQNKSVEPMTQWDCSYFLGGCGPRKCVITTADWHITVMQ